MYVSWYLQLFSSLLFPSTLFQGQRKVWESETDDGKERKGIKLHLSCVAGHILRFDRLSLDIL